MNWVLSIITFVGGGLLGFLLPHVQKPLTDYRKTLTDISKTLLNNGHVMYAPRDNGQPASNEEMNLRYDLRAFHAQLLSSANSIPRFARPILEALGLLQSRAQIEEGARMLIGISNQLVTANKDLPHLIKLNEKLAAALDIAV